MSLSPAQRDIRPQRRADFVMQVTLKNAAGAATSLTGSTFAASVWDKDRVNKYGDFVITVTNAAAGVLQLKLPYAITATLPVGGSAAHYDLMWVNASGLRRYVLEGLVRPSEGYSTP